jgi:uncharacterized protein (DUF362 family)
MRSFFAPRSRLRALFTRKQLRATPIAMKPTVSVKTCREYRFSLVREVLEGIISDLGGHRAFFGTGDRILLKPNLLMSGAPEQAVVTHPVLV